MIYLSLETNKINLLIFKKTILGQYEVGFFEKKHEADLLEKGQITNIDLVASAIKEALTLSSLNTLKEKEICLIIPQDAFYYLRFDAPKDIAPSALNSFIIDKLRANPSINMDDLVCDYIIKDNNDHREVLVYCLEKQALKKYQDSLNLLDLKLVTVLPSTLTFYKLFEKTLRREKKEKILYIQYHKNMLSGYLMDSIGPLPEKTWTKKITDPKDFESILKEKVKDLESHGIKLNRLIISGPESENIRQDTFTKTVGVWTNLLKRIIPNFYQDYLKLLISQKNEALPFLELDDCFGAFIFLQEEKNFSLIKKNPFTNVTQNKPGINFKFPTKYLKYTLLFLASFAFSFIVLSFLSKNKLNFNLPIISVPTPTPTQAPTPTPTPTPVVQKEKLKIKVENGSGTPGKASEVTGLLKNKGYQETLNGGNADNFDYTTTVLKVKKEQINTINTLKTDLKDYTASPKVETLDESENADIVVIIGQDFK